jgi:hypothetical protein
MIDQNVNWRNHRWSYDAEYTERETAPLLSSIIEKCGSMFDERFIYIFQGKKKQFIIRFPHYNTPRTNYRIPTENPSRARARKLQRKLLEAEQQ